MPEPREIRIGGGSSASTTQPLGRFDFPHPAVGKGAPPVTLENVRYLLANSGFVVSFNVIKKRISVRRDGKPATELDIVSLAAQYRMKCPFLLAYVEQIAWENPLNPVKDWIDCQPWDGKDRFEELFATLELADDYPQQLARALLYRWLLGAVSAVTLEGKRFSTRGVLTLQGPQGVGKTSWICNLVSDQALRDDVVKRDHHMDGGNKDLILIAAGHWIVEIGELDGAFRKDIARLKGFLTNDCDKLRPAYAKGFVEYDRRTVFAASVNDAAFLVDPTGNSRFWTIAVAGLNHRHDIDMQQLFAQFRERLREGEQWWLTSGEEQALSTYNLRHRAVCAIAEMVKDHIDIMASGNEVGTYMTPTELLKDLGVPKPSNAQCKECGTTLRELLGEPKRVQGRDRWRIVRRDDFQPDKAMTPVRGRFNASDPEDDY